MSTGRVVLFAVIIILVIVCGFQAYYSEEPPDEPSTLGFQVVEFWQEEAATPNEQNWVKIDHAEFRFHNALLPEADPSKQTSRDQAEPHYIGNCAQYVHDNPGIYDSNDIVVTPVVIIAAENAASRCLMVNDTSEEEHIVLEALAAGNSRLQFTPKEVAFDAPSTWEKRRFDFWLALTSLFAGSGLALIGQRVYERSA